MGTSGAHYTDKAFVSEFEVQLFPTKDGLENIPVDEVEEDATILPKRMRFTMEEDILLVQSWLDVSKDLVIGDDQSGRDFWKKITTNYNTYRANEKEKNTSQLKNRWSKVNSAVQKFVRAYKMAERLKKSGTTQIDIVQAAKKIYREDNNGNEFCLDHAWRLLKDEAKWFTHNNPTANSLKRAMIFESSAYTLGSNLKSEYTPTSPNLVRSQGRKATKKKGKGKLGKTFANDVVGKAAETLKKLANVREREINVKDEYNKRLEEHIKQIDI